MGNGWVLVHTVIAVTGIAVLIVGARITPTISLLLGALYLGLATSVGFSGTIEAISSGFGSLMAEVGLIIGLGVLMGSLMASIGAIESIVATIQRLFRQRGIPYAFAVAIGAILPSIYFDVTLVLLSPLVRRTSARTGLGIAAVAGPLAIGLMIANSIVIPGSAVLAYAGTLNLPIGTMLAYGLPVGVVTAVLSVGLWMMLLRGGLWNAATDEHHVVAPEADVTAAPAAHPIPLFVALSPVLLALFLILLHTVSRTAGVGNPVFAFLGSPVIALLAGTLLAIALARRKLGAERVDEVFDEALRSGGSILLVTGVAGSLGAVIAASGVADLIKSFFEATHFSPLILCWLVAAFLRTAQGAATVSGITAIGIIAPLIQGLEISPVLVALAAGAGASFGGNLSDNAFWMFRSLLGLTTRGTLKAYTLAQSLMSIVTLLLVLGLSLVGV
jgi:H+/gluconate symporter-like permease